MVCEPKMNAAPRQECANILHICECGCRCAPQDGAITSEQKMLNLPRCRPLVPCPESCPPTGDLVEVRRTHNSHQAGIGRTCEAFSSFHVSSHELRHHPLSLPSNVWRFRDRLWWRAFVSRATCSVCVMLPLWCSGMTATRQRADCRR